MSDLRYCIHGRSERQKCAKCNAESAPSDQEVARFYTPMAERQAKGAFVRFEDYAALSADLAVVRQAFHAAMDREEVAEAALQEARKALEVSEIAVADWVNIYAPEYCDAERVEQARRRLNEHGLLAYLAKVTATIRRALSEAP